MLQAPPKAGILQIANLMCKQLLFLISFCLFADVKNADEITKEYLCNSPYSYYTDHVNVFDEIFSVIEVDGFLDLGPGYSTKYFLDHAKHVVSVEFVTQHFGPDWLHVFLELYNSKLNWHPYAYLSDYNQQKSEYLTAPHLKILQGTEKLCFAGSEACKIKNRMRFSSTQYLIEIDQLIEQLLFDFSILYDSTCDAALVDSGMLTRGEFVQALFNRVPIIGAHDIPEIFTQIDPNMDDYGYSTIRTPANYESVWIGGNICLLGVMIWVNKDDPRAEIILPKLKELRLHMYD